MIDEAKGDWRTRLCPEDLAHWERVWGWYEEAERAAQAAGVRYRYIPWHQARGDRSLIGRKAVRAYWMTGGETPWGCQHAHGYASAFETVINIGPDFLATEQRGSEHLISYDTICVQESAV